MTVNSVTKLKVVAKVRGGETIERLVHKFEYVMVNQVLGFLRKRILVLRERRKAERK